MDAVLKLAGTCVAELGKYVTATHAKYAIWAVMGAGSIPKLLGGGPMKKQFPKLPGWFYPPAGLWELAATLLVTKVVELPKNDIIKASSFEVGQYLSLAYLGGVVVNNISIHFKIPDSIPSTILCLFFIGAVGILGVENKTKLTEFHIFSIAAGAGIGAIIGALGEKPVSKKKN
jgi:hypothetical protein